MKRVFLILFIFTNVSFIFLQVYKQSRWTESIYAQQQLETKKKELCAKKESLLHTFCMLKEPNAVKLFAKNKLGMGPVRLQQIKSVQVSHDE